MYIDKFLRNYRDYLQSLDLITDYYPSRLTRGEAYVIDRSTIDVLENFEVNLQYLEDNVDSVKEELSSLYSNIHKKLDKLVELSEGYQRLNTNELLDSSINNLHIYSLKGREYYDVFLESLALPRQSVITNYKSSDIKRDNINATETYKIPSNRVEVLCQVNILDTASTMIKRIVCYAKDGTELLSTTKAIFEVPVETFNIVVITNNVNKDVPSYSSLNILTNKYGTHIRTSVEDKIFKKEGKYLKLVIDRELPTDCYITAKLTIRYKNVLEHVFFNIGNGSQILIPQKEAKGEAVDLLNNKVYEDTIEEEDLVLASEYSTNNEIIKYKGNGVFDISKVNSSEFTIGLAFSLYSITNNTKTPQIKALYAYLTD